MEKGFGQGHIGQSVFWGVSKRKFVWLSIFEKQKIVESSKHKKKNQNAKMKKKIAKSLPPPLHWRRERWVSPPPTARL